MTLSWEQRRRENPEDFLAYVSVCFLILAEGGSHTHSLLLYSNSPQDAQNSTQDTHTHSQEKVHFSQRTSNPTSPSVGDALGRDYRVFNLQHLEVRSRGRREDYGGDDEALKI